MRYTVEIGPEGQVMLPVAIRQELNLAEGKQVWVEVVDGTVMLWPMVPIPHSVRAQLDRHRAEGKVYRGLSGDDLARLGAGEEIDLEPFAVPRETSAAEVEVGAERGDA